MAAATTASSASSASTASTASTAAATSLDPTDAVQPSPEPLGFNDPLHSNYKLQIALPTIVATAAAAASSSSAAATATGAAAGDVKAAVAKEVWISSLVMARHSDWFKRLVESGMRESAEKVVRVVLPAADHYPFVGLLLLAYGASELPVDCRSAAAVIAAVRLCDQFAFAPAILTRVLKAFPLKPNGDCSDDLTAEQCDAVLATPSHVQSAAEFGPVRTAVVRWVEQFTWTRWERAPLLRALSPAALLVFVARMDWERYRSEDAAAWLVLCWAAIGSRAIPPELFAAVRWPLVSAAFLVDFCLLNPSLEAYRPTLQRALHCAMLPDGAVAAGGVVS